MRYKRLLREADYRLYECWYVIHTRFTRVESFTSILRRDNNLLHINISALIELLRQLNTIDLRTNDPVLCDDIQSF